MTKNNLYSKHQHGFRRHRCCVTQLLQVMEDLTEMIDEGSTFDIIYLDFKKAFDQVPHFRLLRKLKAYGITGRVHKWVSNFLCNRKQWVRVGSACSSQANVSSGIPQGSILGPVLFTVFINDLPECVQSYCRVFADDTKIYNKTSDSKVLQHDVDMLQEWSQKWCLFFNSLKCKVLYGGRNNTENVYFMDQDSNKVNVQKCETEKDLGVIFDGKLEFNAHIESVINKSNKIVGILRRTFSYLNKDTFLKLYKALVRPHLEYANVIWYPKYKYQSVSIERVQRRATKLLPETQGMTYEQRLRYLQLPSLKYRRLRGDMIQMFKIMNGIDDLDKQHFFESSKYDRTRNSGDKIFIQHSKTNTRKFSFSRRVAPLWNTKLTPKTKLSTNLNTFKTLLDREPFFFQNKYLFD